MQQSDARKQGEDEFAEWLSTPRTDSGPLAEAYARVVAELRDKYADLDSRCVGRASRTGCPTELI
jgi:hypothetical protein